MKFKTDRLVLPSPARRNRAVLLLIQRGAALEAWQSSGGAPTPLNMEPEALTPGSFSAIRLCLDPEQAVFRSWTLPFTAPRRVEQALRLLLEAELPFDPATLVHAWCRFSDHGQSRIVSASVRAEKLRELLERLKKAGLSPDLITIAPFPCVACQTDLPDVCELRCPCGDSLLAVRLEHSRPVDVQVLPALPHMADKSTALTSPPAVSGTNETPVIGCGNSVPPDWAACTRCTSGSETARIAETLARNVRPALTFPIEKPVSSGQAWTWSAVAAGLAIVGLLVSVWADGLAASRRAAQLENASRGLFQQTFPELAGRVMGTVQMESVFRQRAAGATGPVVQRTSPLVFLRALHEHVPDKLDVRLTSLHFSGNTSELNGTANDYSTVDVLLRSLKAMDSVASVRLVNAGNRKEGAANRVTFQFAVEFRGGKA